MNKLVEREAFTGSLGDELKDFCERFLFKVLRFSMLPWCRERSQIVMLYVELLGVQLVWEHLCRYKNVRASIYCHIIEIL